MNKEADEMGNVSMDKSCSFYSLQPKLACKIKLQDVALQAWSDGGHRRKGVRPVQHWSNRGTSFGSVQWC
eukprot:4943171-Karenia_brevis.AAC.1